MLFFKKNIPTIVFALAVALIIFLRVFVCFIAVVKGDSMLPKFENGQLLLINKCYSSLERGDVIIFKHDGSFLIKRIIGLPGETIQIIDNDIYVNDKKINDFVSVSMNNIGLASDPIRLENDQFFVLGDNRNNSMDSRFFGAITQQQIAGVAQKYK